MKRRFATTPDSTDYFVQKRIETKAFKGVLCFTKMKNINNPLIVFNGEQNVCIRKDNYEWIQAYPDEGNFALTIMFDDNKNLIEWYFDIAKQIGIEDGIPYEDDLYLDMVVMPNGKSIVLDEDELLQAYADKDITKTDLDLAYETMEKLKEKYVDNLDELVDLTNYFYSIFNKENVLTK